MREGRWRVSTRLALLVVATAIGECSERTTARVTGRPFSVDIFASVALGYFAVLAALYGIVLLVRLILRTLRR